MDMEDETAGRAPPPGMPPPPVPEEEEEDEEAPIKVVKNYDRRAARGGPASYDPTKYAVSPITGELVPLAEMAEHMRVSSGGGRGSVWDSFNLRGACPRGGGGGWFQMLQEVQGI